MASMEFEDIRLRQIEEKEGNIKIDPNELGSGGYGHVYKAEYVDHNGVSMNAYCAIKVLDIGRVIDADTMGFSLTEEMYAQKLEDETTRVEREVRLMKNCRGDNVAICYTSGFSDWEEGGHSGRDYYIIMELYVGVPTDCPRFKYSNEVIKYGIDVCKALEKCHNLKPCLIHRDIKPANILWDDINGRYVLADFGISRFLKAGMLSGATYAHTGTRLFSAPEILFGKNEIGVEGIYSVESDIYSLGVTLYMLANGGCLPEGYDPAKDYQRISGEWVFPEINLENEELTKVIMKACSYDRNERYHSAVEMRRALKKAISESEEKVDISIFTSTSEK